MLINLFNFESFKVLLQNNPIGGSKMLKKKIERIFRRFSFNFRKFGTLLRNSGKRMLYVEAFSTEEFLKRIELSRDIRYCVGLVIADSSLGFIQRSALYDDLPKIIFFFNYKIENTQI